LTPWAKPPELTMRESRRFTKSDSWKSTPNSSAALTVFFSNWLMMRGGDARCTAASLARAAHEQHAAVVEGVEADAARQLVDDLQVAPVALVPVLRHVAVLGAHLDVVLPTLEEEDDVVGVGEAVG